MIRLKIANKIEIDQEYEFISNTPYEENGFINNDFSVTKEEFKNIVLPKYIDNSKGINLPEGYVPQTVFFLWDNDQIVGLFRIRHYLNDFLRNRHGHIAYGIKKEFRNRGYATKGLKLAVDEARKIIKEDEIYLSVHKTNPSSLRVQLKNGAYIHNEDENEYYTRIKT